MKKLFKTILFSVAVLGMTSCDFDTMNHQQIPTENAYQSVQDVQNGMNGAYHALGTYRFLGRNVPAYGDFCAGVSLGSPSTGHFYMQSSWVVTETNAELNEMWNYGFKVVDRATRTIKGGKEVLGNAETLHLTEEDIASVKLYMAQCHALKALAYHYLVNIFGLPYMGNENSLGLPIVKDEPIEVFAKVERATVAKTYEQIKSDIQMAEENMKVALDAELDAPSAFYMNPAAIQALKARVYMYLEDYATAETAAKKAIELKGKGDGNKDDVSPLNEIYLTMWTSLAITDEDIFTIAKNESDNLSANALNTLYGSYEAKLDPKVKDLFKDKDVRAKLLAKPSIGKYEGLSTSAATSNVPVFRKSEMSLILAEIYARQNKIDDAKDYLMYTAKRNEDMTIDDLPTTTEELLKFISEERIREFAGEGHRFFDARRMGDKITSSNLTDFDIKKFVFPIPAKEVNSGSGVVQNKGWEDNLPKGR